MSEVPRLDLAPKLKRPLQLWNPLDYFHLLIWILFFPQAICWYIDNFCSNKPLIVNNWLLQIQLLCKDKIWFRFILQAFLLSIATPLFLFLILRLTYAPPSWVSGLLGILFGLFFFINITIDGFKKYGLAPGMTYGITYGIITGLAFIMVSYFVSSYEDANIIFVVSISFIVTIFFAAGFARGAIAGRIPDDIKWVAINIVIGSIIICVGTILLFFLFFLKAGSWAKIASLMIAPLYVYYLGVLKPITWIFWFLFFLSESSFQSKDVFPHATLLPLPFLRRRLHNLLLQDLDCGLYNADQLLLYSCQFLSVIRAINHTIKTISEQKLLRALAKLTQASYYWDLIYFTSCSLSESIKLACVGMLPDRISSIIRSRWKDVPGIDSKSQAAAAGFWYLHDKKPEKAVEAFSFLISVPYGIEMHNLACVLKAAYFASDIHAIADLASNKEFIESFIEKSLPTNSLLHPEAWNSLASLQRVVFEVQILMQDTDYATRCRAFNRALKELKMLLSSLRIIPESVRPLINEIASDWQKALFAFLVKAGGQINIINPYIVGGPVHGRGFIGREDIIKYFKDWWVGSIVPSSVVLYGQRRIGKTSILRNLQDRLGASIHVSYLNLQLLGDALVGGAGEVLLAIAENVTDTLQTKIYNLPKIEEEKFQKSSYRSFEEYLKCLSKCLGDDRLIIVLDEYEQLETWMKKKRVPRDFLKVLRGYIEMNPHIAFVFAGRHTLKEMSANYFEPFFASVNPLKVTFLSKSAVFQLLTNPSEEFPLDYSQDALQLIWELTSGQPYLVQLIGHRLVSRFNDLVFELIKKQASQINESDVKAVINDHDFYQIAESYFNGIWSLAKQGVRGQQSILKSLSQNPEGSSSEELKIATGLTADALNQALRTLERHDVIVKQNDHWRFTVELMRRWVKEKSSL